MWDTFFIYVYFHVCNEYVDDHTFIIEFPKKKMTKKKKNGQRRRNAFGTIEKIELDQGRELFGVSRQGCGTKNLFKEGQR